MRKKALQALPVPEPSVNPTSAPRRPPGQSGRSGLLRRTPAPGRQASADEGSRAFGCPSRGLRVLGNLQLRGSGAATLLTGKGIEI